METKEDRAVKACRMIVELEEEDNELCPIAQVLLGYYVDQKISLQQVQEALRLVKMLHGQCISREDAEKIAQAILAKEKRGCHRLIA